MAQNIQWFPGHMAKAKRQVQEKLKYVDIVFELVDARLPISSRNPMLDTILGEKKRLILINKADLADMNQSKKWQEYFENEGHKSLIINAKESKTSKEIVSAAKAVLAEKLARDKERGIQNKAIRAMVIGIPNVGKSTLMNRLVGKKIAQVGNKPGVTKGQQWLKSGNELELLDTPGILWPRFEDEEIGMKLAVTGAIKDQLLHLDDLCIYALEFFARHYPESLKQRYQLSEDDLFLGGADMLMLITKKRGFRDDWERAAEMIINEIRSGKLGRYTLDVYEEMAASLDGK
jgi:ribosome biogenesis GTPase A